VIGLVEIGVLCNSGALLCFVKWWEEEEREPKFWGECWIEGAARRSGTCRVNYLTVWTFAIFR
jgi:hypothetical protein